MSSFRFMPLCLALLLFAALPGRAQTYDLRFVPSVNTAQDTLSLLVQIRVQDGQYPLGSSNLVFTYNDAVLSFPSENTSQAGVDYSFINFLEGANYNTPTVTRAESGRVSVNVSNKNAGLGTDVSTAFMDVAVVRLRILNTNGTSDFAWDGANTIVIRPDLAGQWTQGTLSTQSNVPLPVELADFQAVVDGGGIQVYWKTMSETNNAGFEVQYVHRDSTAFRSAGFVEGHGTRATENSYAYRFTPAAPGTYRVRLKQVDFDGGFSYLPETEITVTQLESADGALVDYLVGAPSPNPFANHTALSLQVTRAQHVQAHLYNTIGQRVVTVFDRAVAAGAVQQLRIEAEGLAAGIYLLRVMGETFSETREVVIVR